MFKIEIKDADGVVVGWIETADPTAQIQAYTDNGQWVGCTFHVTDISYEHALAECIEKRIAEYPQLGDFLNAYFDGGELEIEQLRQQRLAVKAKYPKPTQGGV
jgi:hypothetical protein